MFDGVEGPPFAPRGHHHPRTHRRGHHHGPSPFHFFEGWDSPSQHGNHHRQQGPPFWGWWQNETPGASQPASNDEPTPGPSTSTEKTPEQEKGVNPTDNEQNAESEDERRCDNKGKGKHNTEGRHAQGRGCRGRRMGGRGGWGRPHSYAGPHEHFGPPHHCGGPHRGRGGRHGRGGFGGRRGGPGAPDFDFLRHLASQFGFPTNEPTDNNVDFTPSVDMFDTPTSYIVHVSLPGAKKEDLSIDYDTDESVLRLAGVVYRPGLDEDLHRALVMEERNHDVGVFEREIRLGSRQAPASVLADEIAAKLEDGILKMTIPKIEKPEPAPKKVTVEDLNTSEKRPVDENAPSVTLTPDESEESDYEDQEEASEYVKVPVH